MSSFDSEALLNKHLRLHKEVQAFWNHKSLPDLLESKSKGYAHHEVELQLQGVVGGGGLYLYQP